VIIKRWLAQVNDWRILIMLGKIMIKLIQVGVQFGKIKTFFGWLLTCQTCKSY